MRNRIRHCNVVFQVTLCISVICFTYLNWNTVWQKKNKTKNRRRNRVDLNSSISNRMIWNVSSTNQVNNSWLQNWWDHRWLKCRKHKFCSLAAFKHSSSLSSSASVKTLVLMWNGWNMNWIYLDLIICFFKLSFKTITECANGVQLQFNNGSYHIVKLYVLIARIEIWFIKELQ